MFSSHPRSAQWSEKNILKPNQVALKSGKKFWFNCDKCPHDFESVIHTIANGSWCPYCSKHKRCIKETCIMCFNNSFASHQYSTLWSSKNTIQPRNVAICANKSFWFKCDKCPHEFEAMLNSITSGGWCPYCANKQRCDSENCTTCFNKSFASHPRSAQWSVKNMILPRGVSRCNNKRFWFNCDKCPHEFKCALEHIIAGCWCPYCANKQRCDNEACTTCFNKSFASHPRSAQWSTKNVIQPRDISLCNGVKGWFDCDICNHEFECNIYSIISGSWCPYCANKQRCDNEACTTCFNKSFASHPRSAQWSVKNTMQPRDVSICANKSFWFKCDKCPHEFEKVLTSIAKNSWCPFCVNKTESKLYETLIGHYPTLINQFKQDWCMKSRHLPFDFCIPEDRIIIELDGRQHFQQVRNWSTPEEQFENDKYKESCANDNNYSVIRIIQEDVWNDAYDWVKTLHDSIEEIKAGDDIVNIYLCKNGEYGNF